MFVVEGEGSRLNFATRLSKRWRRSIGVLARTPAPRCLWAVHCSLFTVRKRALIDFVGDAFHFYGGVPGGEADYYPEPPGFWTSTVPPRAFLRRR